jgi:hypothetical protein
VTAAILQAQFPNLNATNYVITSPVDPGYNCIAWAADNADRWWWPLYGHYWPPGMPFDLTIDNFARLFEAMGFERVAIYAQNGVPTHGAKQLPTGRWSSKLGSSEDVDHESLMLLEGAKYGQVAVILRRLLPSP